MTRDDYKKIGALTDDELTSLTWVTTKSLADTMSQRDAVEQWKHDAIAKHQANLAATVEPLQQQVAELQATITEQDAAAKDRQATYDAANELLAKYDPQIQADRKAVAIEQAKRDYADAMERAKAAEAAMAELEK